MFRNLTRLDVWTDCRDTNGNDQCAFELRDDDVAELAMALPRLKHIDLGHPCPENTCATTVACLLSISVHCVEVQTLAIHFNTTNITDDLKNISEGPRFQELHSLPKCSLPRFKAYRTPLTLDEPGLDAVANGMVNIFPSLKRCGGYYKAWGELDKRIKKMQMLLARRQRG